MAEADDPPKTALDEIRAREQAATRGPWKVEREHGHDIDGDPFSIPSVTGPDGREILLGLVDQPAADLHFTAHARTDIPCLLAGIDEALKLHACEGWYVAADDCEHPEPPDDTDAWHDWTDGHVPGSGDAAMVCLLTQVDAFCPECTRLKFSDEGPDREFYVPAPCGTRKAILIALTGKEHGDGPR